MKTGLNTLAAHSRIKKQILPELDNSFNKDLANKTFTSEVRSGLSKEDKEQGLTDRSENNKTPPSNL